ncbi:MAG: protein kinase domain-containing protein [Candidatus Aminicenantales bacterium]
MLATGTRLGPYEILAPLGAGGMGEVYRARDTKLGRDVAVKVLPADLTTNPDALSRFEREAHAVAQLSHPNILAIHDFGQQGETAYAVMELLEGETLRARLENGALPVRKAADLAVQIAEGLAAAHEKGIVHRDLKPENVFVTHEGRVKLLDFGLAKTSGRPVVPESRTLSMERHTGPGTVMGTVGYMSPEQVRGEVADHRSDIFSFGAVLYEMLAGRRAFQHDTAAETMTAILKEDPSEIPTTGTASSPALMRVVRHCLEKKPGERFQSARDIAFALQALSGSAVASGPSVAVKRRVRWPWLAVLVVAAVLGIVASVSYRKGEKAERRSAAGITFRQMSFSPEAIFQAAFAPDGETIIYSTALEGVVPEMFMIRPEFPEPRPLGLPGTHLLSISSKGELAVLTNARYIAHRLFIGTLARVSLGSTAPREIHEEVRQADWSPDGSELAIIRMADGKDRLEFPIGKVLYETAGYLSDLRVSPRGDRIALFEHPVQWDDRGSVIVVDRMGKRTLLSGDYWGEEGLAWSQTGEEVLFTASTLGGAQILYGVDLSGNRRVALSSAGGLTMHDVSHTGRWLVTRDDLRGEISVLAPGASAERDLSWLDASALPFLSRDGRMLLFKDESSSAGQNYEVCLRRTDGGPVLRLGEGSPMGLSPDGKWALAIIFTPPQLVIYPTGPGEIRRLPRGDLETYQSADWFPDGMHVLVVGNEAGKASRCYAQDVLGGPPRPVTPEATTKGVVSPDGLQILCSKPGGAWFIQPVERGPAQTMPGLTTDDQVIRWRADGRSLYLFRPSYVPFRLERLDVASGRRDLIREVAPADKAGVFRISGAALTDDTKSYAYGYDRMRSQLFMVEGAR